MSPIKNDRFYIARHAGKKIVFRNIIRKKAGAIEPVIQVEILDNSKCFPIIRCDRKKGQRVFHRDMYNRAGIKVESHRRLRSQTSKEAIVEIIDMLTEKLPDLLNQLDFGYMLSELPKDWKSQLESAKEFLLTQITHPERIVWGSGTTALGFSADAILSDQVFTKLIKGKKEE